MESNEPWSDPVGKNQSTKSSSIEKFGISAPASETANRTSLTLLADTDLVHLATGAKDLAQPAVAGLTSRFAYLALSGQLYVDKDSIARTIAGAKSPVAAQIVDKIHELEAKDWRFSKGPVNCPTSGFYEPFTRSIWYSTGGLAEEFRYILGTGDNPQKIAAPLLAHELAHHDINTVAYWISPDDSEAAAVMAKRHLIAETRAMTAEVHIGQQIGVLSSNGKVRAAAMKAGKLADAIIDSHPNADYAPRTEATDLVNNYLDNTYGKNLVDPSTGKVRPFDLRAGFGKNRVAALPTDAEYFAELNKPGNYLAMRNDSLFEFRKFEVKGHPAISSLLEETKFLRAGESKAASIIGHSSRALGAVSLFLAANDIVGQYRLSSAAGTGRLARVLTDWAGFEVGAAGARSLVKALAIRNPYAATAIVIGAAASASNAFDLSLGKRLETAIRDIRIQKR
jgi:hypothetical protein